MEPVDRLSIPKSRNLIYIYYLNFYPYVVLDRWNRAGTVGTNSARCSTELQSVPGGWNRSLFRILNDLWVGVPQFPPHTGLLKRATRIDRRSPYSRCQV